MPRKKRNEIREAALRREAAKRAKRAELLAEEIAEKEEILRDPTYEQSGTDTDSESDSDVELLAVPAQMENAEIVASPAVTGPSEHNVNSTADTIHFKKKRKEIQEDRDIHPDKSSKIARTTQWRYANGKTKKARAINMQPSIASVFKINPSKVKSAELPGPEEIPRTSTSMLRTI